MSTIKFKTILLLLLVSVTAWSDDSKYSWLNDALFICEPEFSPHFKGVILNIWKIK